MRKLPAPDEARPRRIAKPVSKSDARRSESDEAKARHIAARDGITW